MRAMRNGSVLAVEELLVPFTDEGISRGDGVFETIGVWGGRPFRLDDHLERLAYSLDAIGLPPVDLELLRAEAGRLLDGVGPVDAALRIYVTASGMRILTLLPPPVRPALRRLRSQLAPWIRPVGSYGPAGAKTISYGPNMAATRAARRAGGDDALLLALEGYVLEGPTFSLLWVHEDTLRTPTLSLGIVDSISRRTLLEVAPEAGLRVVEGRWMVDDLRAASEVLACSSVRHLEAIEEVDHLRFGGPTPMRDALAALLTARRRGG